MAATLTLCVSRKMLSSVCLLPIPLAFHCSMLNVLSDTVGVWAGLGGGEPLIHTQLRQSPSQHFPWDSIKCLFQIHKSIVQLFFFDWCFFCTCLMMKMASVVPLPGMKPNSMFSMTPDI